MRRHVDPSSFNRTFLVLKGSIQTPSIALDFGFNRTFLVLKAYYVNRYKLSV